MSLISTYPQFLPKTTRTSHPINTLQFTILAGSITGDLNT